MTSPESAGFIPHKPDPTLCGSIVYAVRLDYFGKLSKGDQDKLSELNPNANTKAPVFYVGTTTLQAEQRYENHINGYKASRWVKKYGKNPIRVDEWKPDFGVALSEKTLRAAWQLARRSDADPAQRERELTDLLRSQGFYVVSN